MIENPVKEAFNKYLASAKFQYLVILKTQPVTHLAKLAADRGVSVDRYIKDQVDEWLKGLGQSKKAFIGIKKKNRHIAELWLLLAGRDITDRQIYAIKENWQGSAQVMPINKENSCMIKHAVNKMEGREDDMQIMRNEAVRFEQIVHSDTYTTKPRLTLEID